MWFWEVINANGENEGKVSFNAASFTLIKLGAKLPKNCQMTCAFWIVFVVFCVFHPARKITGLIIGNTHLLARSESILFENVIVSFKAASFTLIQLCAKLWKNCLFFAQLFYEDEYNGQWKQAWKLYCWMQYCGVTILDSSALSLLANSE